MLLPDTHSTDTQQASGTSGLDEAAAVLETEIERASGGEEEDRTGRDREQSGQCRVGAIRGHMSLQDTIAFGC
jgi:hypothetical protein